MWSYLKCRSWPKKNLLSPGHVITIELPMQNPTSYGYYTNRNSMFRNRELPLLWPWPKFRTFDGAHILNFSQVLRLQITEHCSNIEHCFFLKRVLNRLIISPFRSLASYRNIKSIIEIWRYPFSQTPLPHQVKWLLKFSWHKHKL